MLFHESCGGELRKVRKGSAWYACRACRERLKIGSPRGSNHPGVAEAHHRTAGVKTYYPTPHAEDTQGSEDHMSLHSLIATGGRVLVVGGQFNKGWESFAKHPQITFWCGDQSEIRRYMRNGTNLPSNTKGVIVSRFISHTESTKVIEEAKRHRATIMAAKNDGEITRLLEEITETSTSTTTPPVTTPTAPAPTPLSSPKPIRSKSGLLKAFVEKHHQAELVNTDEGRRIFKLAQAAGLPTTEGSVCNTVSAYRKKLGIVIGPIAQARARAREKAERKAQREAKKVAADGLPEIVPLKAAQPQVPNEPLGTDDGILKMIDDCVAGLSLVREEVARFSRHRDKYARLKATLKQLIKE